MTWAKTNLPVYIVMTFPVRKTRIDRSQPPLKSVTAIKLN